MKLTDLFSRTRRRPHQADKIETAARLSADVGNRLDNRLDNRLGSDVTDRSSMAELVRLLKEAEDAQAASGRQPL